MEADFPNRPCLTSIGHGGPTIVSSRSSQWVWALHSSPLRSAAHGLSSSSMTRTNSDMQSLSLGDLSAKWAYSGICPMRSHASGSSGVTRVNYS